MKKLICECCGGDIDPKTATCRYCDTVYLSAYIKESVVEKYYETKRDSETIIAQMRVQDLYDSAIKSMRDYAYGTRERRGFQ